MTRRRWQLTALVGFALLVLASTLLRRRYGIELDADSLRLQVESLGPLAPVLFVAALSLRFVLLIPSSLLLTVGGACFGVTFGTLYGALGLTLMGLVQFLIVQLAGADALRARVPARFAGTLVAARSWRGAATLALLSAYPVSPQTPIQLAAALAGMGLVTFLASVGFGALLRAGLFAWFGSSLIEGESTLLAAALLSAAIALPFLHPRTRASALRVLRGSAESAQSEDRG